MSHFPIYLYNSLTNRKEIFTPIHPPNVKMYSCGPTVYDFAHIGNFRSFLLSDLLHRLLKNLGYNVTLIMNITDIDDKTISISNQKKISLQQFTNPYINAFFQDLKSLHFTSATHYPKATESIYEMQAMIKTLIDKKKAYFRDGSVYFNVNSFQAYGKLSNITLERQRVGASNRVNSDEYDKENLSDFALWKGYTKDDGEIFWDDEILGKGRPGWHIECSAMIKKTIGNHIDIHTGGIDNQFPHHENEIAQSICCNDSPFVNYWIHCSHLLVEGKKMSKSFGNFYTLRDLLEKKINPIPMRYLLLSAHYRSHLNFTFDGIVAAERAIQRVNRLIENLYKQKNIQKPIQIDSSLQKKVCSEINLGREKFFSYLTDDLNVSAALSVVFEIVTTVNKRIDSISRETIGVALDFFKTADNIFATFKFSSNRENSGDNELENLPMNVKDLIDERDIAKRNRNFVLADQLRANIEDLGYQIIDTPNGRIQCQKIVN